MKKLNYLLSLLVVIGMAFTFTSCEEEGDAVPPSISLVSGEGYISADATVAPGATLMFKVDVRKGDANLDMLTATKDGSPIASSPYEDIDNSADVIEISVDAPAGAGAYGYKFEVTDKDGEMASVSVTVTVEEAGTPFAKEVTGAIFSHLYGPDEGAWDLANEVALGWSDAATSKSLANTDQAGETFTGSWTSDPSHADEHAQGNGTMFVMDNSFDYANATMEAAQTAYEAGTASLNVANPAVDDIYIAKKDANYYVIKVTEVDPTYDSGGATNLGRLTFTYWK